MFSSPSSGAFFSAVRRSSTRSMQLPPQNCARAVKGGVKGKEAK